MKHPRRSLVLLAGCFVLLQAADLFLTQALLPRPDVREANPLALAVLVRHGWMGVVVLKVTCTAVALGMTLLVWRRRAATGTRLLGGCCALMTVVVGYSLTLLIRPSPVTGADLAGLHQRSCLLDAQAASLKRLQSSRCAICRDLLAGRLLFPRAVEKMARSIDRCRFTLPPSNSGNLPPTDSPSHVAVYLIFHLRMLGEAYAPADRLAALESEVVTRYPDRPAFDFAAIRAAMAAGARPPWAPERSRDNAPSHSPSS